MPPKAKGVFPLPLWNEYKQYTKGVHGDIANIPSGDTKYGGTITAGMFKVGVFLSNKPQNLPTDPIEYAFIGQVVTFSISGLSKSRQEFEEWKIKTIREATDSEIDDHKKVYPTSS